MKINLYSFFCFYLVVPGNVVSGFYKTYEPYKKQWKAKDNWKAKKWIDKDYHEAKKYFEEAGILKEGKDAVYSFAHDDLASVDKTVWHDVMATFFLSDFVYAIGTLRYRTKTLGITDDEILEEVCVGPSFKNADKSKMVKLLNGDLTDEKNAVGSIPMEQIEDILNLEKYRGVGSPGARFARESTITALHAFKDPAVDFSLYKFSAKYNDKNLVYAVAGNKKRKELYLTFRGSTTIRDWIQNLSTPLVDIELRKDVSRKDDDGKSRCYMIEPLTYQTIEISEALYNEFVAIVKQANEPIRIHKGFLGYLFADRGENDLKRVLDDSMMTNIQKDMLPLLKSGKFDSLYVTGHSLGGALAHTAAFFLASSAEFNNNSEINGWKGLKCITFAAPSSGNISFQRCFEVLARKSHPQSMLRKIGSKRLFTNIRVTNSRDLVPTAVPFSKFRHTPGITVHLGRPFVFNTIIMYFLGGIPFFKRHDLARPTIRQVRAHWKSTWPWQDEWDWRFPWMVFSPRSFVAGFFASWGRLLSMVLTTVPIFFIILQLLIRPIYMLLPRFLPVVKRMDNGTLDYPFYQVFKALKKWDFLQELVDNKWTPINWIKVIVEWSWENVGQNVLHLDHLLKWLFVENLYIPASLVLFWALFFPAGLMVSLGLVFVGIPAFIVILSKEFLAPDKYEWITMNGAAAFIVTMLVLQVLVLPPRRALDVLGGLKVHLLPNYYKHLRPYHKDLSSSEVLLDNHYKDV
jgi:hypothetical protein